MIIPAKNKDENKPKKNTFEKLSSAVSLNSEQYTSIARLVGILYLIVGIVVAFGTPLFGIGVLILGYINYIIVNWFGLVLRGLEQNNHILLKILKDKDK